MHTAREILRLRFELRLKARQVARSLKISHSTVLEYEKRARAAGLAWPLPEGMDDGELEQLLAKPVSEERAGSGGTARPMPEIGYLASELKKKGVTLNLLWEEYKRQYPEGYQYSQFCYHYQIGQKKLDFSLRQEHRAGEKLFVDYAGQTVPIVDKETGEIKEASIFVAVLGASNYTYARATGSEGLVDWVSSHVLAFEYFGGVPELIIPDNTKVAVKKACRYEPVMNRIYQEMATYYGTAILPTRVKKPKDKAKVEAGVQFVERVILAVLRKRTFFSLAEVNAAISELLSRLNRRPFKKLKSNRLELFEKLDKPALRPLPSERYAYVEWKIARVNIDYHIEVERHLYSVPYQLLGEQVEVLLSPLTVEILYKNRRVASHLRSSKAGGFTTDPSHRPLSHQHYLEWTPERLIAWAAKIGPATADLVEKILKGRPHPEQGYRSCLGLLRLGKKYSPERLEEACAYGLTLQSYSYHRIKSILKTQVDRKPFSKQASQKPLPLHDNLRGSDYYQNL